MIAITLFDTTLTLAFGAGMLAAVNPCGFAMLPAYLSFFVGQEGDERGGLARAGVRALGVGAALTAGFMVVFGVMGIVISQVSHAVQDALKYFTIGIGLALVVLGIYLLSGRQLNLRGPKLQKGGDSRQIGSMFLFGVSYATASLTCTIGPFLSVTSFAFNDGGAVRGSLVFVSYALGMGALITALTVAVALARGGVVAGFRKAMRWVNPASGVLVLLAGLYMAYYGWYEVRLDRSDTVVKDPIIDRAIKLQSSISSWIDQVGTGRLGLISLGIVAALVAATTTGRVLRNRRHGAGDEPAEIAVSSDATR